MSAKNIELFRSYSRHSAIPMDVTSLYKTYKEAAAYVSENKAAYAGQVISVVSEVTGAVTVYKIAYGENDSLKLIEIGSGSGDGSGFEVKGSYNTYAELVAAQTNPDDGDIYLVCKAGQNANGDWYGAFYMAENGVFISISPQQFVYATELHGGIITKETFTSLVNKEGSPAIYFSSGEGTTSDPGNNGWVSIATQGSESAYGSNRMTIPSTNRVLRLIANGGSDIPSASLENTSTDLSDSNAVDATGTASFDIIFHQGLAGDIASIKIELNGSVVVSGWVPDAGVMTYDKKNGEIADIRVSYTYSGSGMIRSDGSSNIFKAVVSYESSDSLAAGSVEASMNYGFHSPVRFGTDYLNISRDNVYTHIRRTGADRLLANDMTYSVKLDPSSPFDGVGDDTDEGISGLWIRISNTYVVKSVYWSQQQNVDFLPIFEKKADPDDASRSYYEFTSNEEFSTPSEFTVTIVKAS